MTIWTKSFGLALFERVIATFLMTFLAVTGLDAGGAIGGAGIDKIDWLNSLIAAAIAAGLSAIKCVIANLVTKDGPSLTHAEQVEPDLPNTPQS
jgi:hypothetical protein